MSAAVAHHSFWAGTPALVAVALGCAVLVTFALLTVLGSRLRRHDLRARVEEVAPQAVPAALEVGGGQAREPAREWTDLVFDHRSWWVSFKEKLELARIERSGGDIVLITAFATLLGAAAVAVVTGVPVLALAALGLGPAAMVGLVNQRVARQRDQFGEQLPLHLEELASAMRAGHSLVGGLRTIAVSAAEPMRTELERVLADEQLGVPLDAALAPMARRMDSEEVKQVALVAALHERTGGNMAAVLDLVAGGVRDRMELRRELRSLTAQARLSRWVVTMLPPMLLVVIGLIDSAYLRPLFETSTGLLLLFVALGMVITGSLVMRAIVDVEA